MMEQPPLLENAMEFKKGMRPLAAHSFYIYCASHSLQLASMQAANSVPEIRKMFGTMGNIWKFFFYSPKKAESLKAVQSVLKLPELKIVKPSDTRWLSHEHCVRAIYRELPSLIVTLQQLYETSGDAEAYGIGTLLATYTGVASIVFLSEFLDNYYNLLLLIIFEFAIASMLPSLYCSCLHYCTVLHKKFH